VAPQETDQALGNHPHLHFRGQMEIQLSHSHHHLERRGGEGGVTSSPVTQPHRYRMKVACDMLSVWLLKHFENPLISMFSLFVFILLRLLSKGGFEERI